MIDERVAMRRTVEIEDIQIVWSYAEPEFPAVVVVKGELDLNLAYRLRAALFELINLISPGRDLYVDLRSVEYISSAGVGILSAALVHASERNIRFFISTLRPKVRSVFDTLGLLAWFTERDPIAAES
jgi:anti-anti-sigma factor